MSYSPNALGNKTSAQHLNNSGGTLTKTTPVRVDSEGNLKSINISQGSEVEALVGLIEKDSGDGEFVSVVQTGIIEDITTSFNFGDRIFMSKSGGLTNIQPDVGVGGFLAGDFVISIGIITKNIENPSKKDLLLYIINRGQLA